MGVGYRKEQRLSMEANQQDGALLAGVANKQVSMASKRPPVYQQKCLVARAEAHQEETTGMSTQTESQGAKSQLASEALILPVLLASPSAQSH